MKATDIGTNWIGTRAAIKHVFLNDVTRCICGDHIMEYGICEGSARDTWHRVREVLEVNKLWDLKKLSRNLQALCRQTTSEVSVGGLGIDEAVTRNSWLHIRGHELKVSDLLFVTADMMLCSPKDPE